MPFKGSSENGPSGGLCPLLRAERQRFCLRSALPPSKIGTSGRFLPPPSAREARRLSAAGPGKGFSQDMHEKRIGISPVSPKMRIGGTHQGFSQDMREKTDRHISGKPENADRWDTSRVFPKYARKNRSVDRQQKISSQIKQQRPKEYFVYFKAFVVQSWGERFADLAARCFEGISHKKGAGRILHSPRLDSRFAMSDITLCKPKSCKWESVLFLNRIRQTEPCGPWHDDGPVPCGHWK